MYNSADVDGWRLPLFERGFGSPTRSSSTSVRPERAGWMPQARPRLAFTIPGGSPFTLDLSNMTQVAADFQFKADRRRQRAKRHREGGGRYRRHDVRDLQRRDAACEVSHSARDGAEPGQSFVRKWVTSIRSGSTPGIYRSASRGKAALGTIKPEALEQSNVDLASELTSMIEFAAWLHREFQGLPDRRGSARRSRQSEALSATVDH